MEKQKYFDKKDLDYWWKSVKVDTITYAQSNILDKWNIVNG